jgi:hypothetical protein
MSLGSRQTWACSKAGFSSQNGDCAWGMYYKRVAFCCAVFVSKRAQCRGYSCS